MAGDMLVFRLLAISLLCTHDAYCHLLPPSVWQDWKDLHGRHYSTQAEEYSKMATFAKNYLLVQQHNERYQLGLETFQIDLNDFADMTPSEFGGKYLTSGNPTNTLGTSADYAQIGDVDELPESVDWREGGFVTPVAKQGDCGACYAFAAIGALEGAVKKKWGVLVDFSEQQIVDCGGDSGNLGCYGGHMFYAFEHLVKNGAMTEADYKYIDGVGECYFHPYYVVANVVSYKILAAKNEDELMRAVALVGPIAVGIDASRQNFRLYKSGIYSDECCTDDALGHAVLVVGYGKDVNGTAFWIVKNSWGKEWGMDGYMLIARNQSNMCGIATMASYPIV